MNEWPLIPGNEAQVLSLPAETRYAPNGIVSRTLFRAANGRVVLFGFAEGQELSEHTSTMGAIVQMLSGECEMSLNGKPVPIKAGDLVYMPPQLPHALRATSQCSLLLTLIKS